MAGRREVQPVVEVGQVRSTVETYGHAVLLPRGGASSRSTRGTFAARAGAVAGPTTTVRYGAAARITRAKPALISARLRS